jgi:general secretion pathway protein A
MDEPVLDLRERPFAWAPRTGLYYPAASIENAYQNLVRCIERAAGPGLVIGGTGMGKSLLCLRLAERFREPYHVALLNSAQLFTRLDLLQNIHFALGLPYRGLEEGELRLSLFDFLDPARSSRGGLVLLVDEADTLPLRLLEELRMLTNLVRDGQPRVRLVLVGGPILEERFAHPKLECFQQRIAARCYLQPLSYDETCQYVRAQIAAAGGDPDQLVAGDAYQAVFHASDGIPRLINQVCDHALVLAAAGQRSQLDGAIIQEAWADLQQLPTPWQDAPRTASQASNVIEFGALDEPADHPGAAADSALEQAAEDQDTEVFELGPPQGDLALRVDPVYDDEEGGALPSPTPADASEPTGTAALPPVAESAPVSGPEWVAESERLAEAEPERVATPRPSVADPFAEDFEYEEVVIDRYAAMEAASLWFAPVGRTAPGPSGGVTRGVGVQEGGAADEPHSAVAGPQRIEVIRALPQDDNDLIVIVDESPHTPWNAATTGQQDYRHLFSRLRQS